MTARDLELILQAARVPATVEPQAFGPWTIERRAAPAPDLMRAAGLDPVGWPDFTLLWHTLPPNPEDPYIAEVSCVRGYRDIVMEDSRRELLQHVPIWRAAHGRVLVTGLGLGCVVRGLLASPAVEHVDVVEIDEGILRVVGPEFASDPRVTLHHGDALTHAWPAGARWDCAWHDLWFENASLHVAHVELMQRMRDRVPRQGAWKLPRLAKRLLGVELR